MATQPFISKPYQFSEIFPGKEIMYFHQNPLPEFDESIKYTVLGLVFINRKFLLVQKNNGLLAIPGGGSELTLKHLSALHTALNNAGCDPSIHHDVLNVIKGQQHNFVQANGVREVLEETGVLTCNPNYFGHQKTRAYRDEITLVSREAHWFNKQGIPDMIEALEVLFEKKFKKIGKSVRHVNPFVILTVDDMIKNISRLVGSHQAVMANFLLTLLDSEIEVGYKKQELEAIASYSY